jgi:hypothetical protein
MLNEFPVCDLGLAVTLALARTCLDAFPSGRLRTLIAFCSDAIGFQLAD